VLLVVTLSAFFVKHAELGQAALFLRSLAHVAPFVLLVLLQPHLAGAASLLAIWLAVSVTAGLSWRVVAVAAALVAVLGAAAWLTPGLIRPYMRDRIEAMVRPDAQAGSYQQDQALIALGVGGATGVGYLQGERKSSGYIPEQQNDFVLSVIGEEGGMVACAMLFAGFILFFARVWYVGHRSEHPFGRMAAAGVLAVLGFHVFVNLGMNLGVLPVAGLWLPFVSYGGTALWMCMACLGILLGQR
jgi:rod shape determining protein RodA